MKEVLDREVRLSYWDKVKQVFIMLETADIFYRYFYYSDICTAMFVKLIVLHRQLGIYDLLENMRRIVNDRETTKL